MKRHLLKPHERKVANSYKPRSACYRLKLSSAASNERLVTADLQGNS